MDTVDAFENIVRLIVSMRERSPALDAGRIICETSSLDAMAWLISQDAVYIGDHRALEVTERDSPNVRCIIHSDNFESTLN